MPKRTPRRASTCVSRLTLPPDRPDPTLDRVRGHVAVVGEIIDRLSRGERPSVDDVRAVRHAVVTAAVHRRDQDGLTTPALNAVGELDRRCRRASILIGDALNIDPTKLDASATSSAWLIAETRAGVRQSPAPAAATSAFMDARQIADALGCPDRIESVRSALRRARERNRIADTDWIENSDPHHKQAQTIYRFEAVRPLLDRFAVNSK